MMEIKITINNFTIPNPIIMIKVYIDHKGQLPRPSPGFIKSNVDH